MKMTMKHGALALALLGSAALFAGPTLANSLHDEVWWRVHDNRSWWT